MATFNCSCGTGGIGNLGLPSCSDLLQVVARVIILPTYADDGTRNSILSSDFSAGVLPANFINAKLIETDASKRWNITDKLFDEVEISNTDRTTQTTSSGAMYELLQGVVTFSGKLYKRPPAYKGQLNSAKCGENSVYLVDTTGRLMGEVSDDGLTLFPLELQEGSIVAEWFPKSDSSESYVSFDFQLDRIVSSENFLTIPSGNITENLKKAESLIDVALVEGTGTQSVTTLFVDANYSLYGTFGNKGALEGKVGLTAWDIDGANPTAVTEATPGVYELTVANTSPAIVKYVEVRTSATTKGFESNELTITY
tara:strand:+ start:6250 stop:7185 length:936 start_codon:yes stop_codon:yes gene_type:complete